jgi:hypothetical protein
MNIHELFMNCVHELLIKVPEMSMKVHENHPTTNRRELMNYMNFNELQLVHELLEFMNFEELVVHELFMNTS